MSQSRSYVRGSQPYSARGTQKNFAAHVLVGSAAKLNWLCSKERKLLSAKKELTIHWLWNTELSIPIIFEWNKRWHIKWLKKSFFDQAYTWQSNLLIKAKEINLSSSRDMFWRCCECTEVRSVWKIGLEFSPELLAKPPVVNFTNILKDSFSHDYLLPKKYKP